MSGGGFPGSGAGRVVGCAFTCGMRTLIASVRVPLKSTLVGKSSSAWPFQPPVPCLSCGYRVEAGGLHHQPLSLAAKRHDRLRLLVVADLLHRYVFDDDGLRPPLQIGAL